MVTVTEGASVARAAGRAVKDDAPWRWLAKGAAIYGRQPVLSAGYGILFVAIGFGIASVLRANGLIAALPVSIGSFALVGPLLAVGLYAIARADEQGRKATAAEVLLPKAASPLQIAYLAIILLLAMQVWVVIAIGLLAMFFGFDQVGFREFTAFALTTPSGLLMIAIGSVLGGFIAFSVFAATAFSIPMLMDRDTDFASAIIASVQTVGENRRMMLLWAWIIALAIALGVVTLMMSFVVAFPVLGYATWTGYREMFPKS